MEPKDLRTDDANKGIENAQILRLRLRFHQDDGFFKLSLLP